MDDGVIKFAKKVGVTPETVRKWCREGKIQGATQDKKGSPWHIPANAVRPMRKSKK